MICPKCRVGVHVSLNRWLSLGAFSVSGDVCPECQTPIVAIKNSAGQTTVIYPLGSVRGPCPSEVPAAIAADYQEAAVVLPVSPKASAALSRRCLQHVLREAGGVREKTLHAEIEKVLNKDQFPSETEQLLHAVREIGNFAAHPLKDEATGEIIDVEPGEAELNLDVLDALFDFYYVQPAVRRRRLDGLDQKLAAAGKKPI